MKKFNITSEKLAIVVLTVIQVLCIFIAAGFALDEFNGTSYNALGAIMYLALTVLIEWVKWKITHNDNNNIQTT